MAIKPILFSTDMVRAILDGRKTVTRRVMKPQPVFKGGFWEFYGAGWGDGTKNIRPIYGHTMYSHAPYHLGDIIYVRETWCKSPFTNHYIYRADGEQELFTQSIDSEIMDDTVWKWHPSIHMPREAARIWLRVTDVRVERLQDITEKQATSEGFKPEPFFEDGGVLPALWWYAGAWRNRIKKSDRDLYGWSANPFVWVVEFERCERPEEAL